MLNGICGKNNILNNYLLIFNSDNGFDDFNIFLKENSYSIIKDSKAFDEKFYIKNYMQNVESNISPIEHYLKYGTSKNFNPNSIFNTKEYIELNEELNGLNPFVHHILYDDSFVIDCVNFYLDNTVFSYENFFNISKSFENGITIILPIFNEYKNTKKCIESILEHTSIKFQLILLVNINSKDDILNLLNQYNNFPNILTIYYNSNLDLINNINNVMLKSDNDIFILNKYLSVTPHWIQKIILESYSDENIGILIPLFNLLYPNFNIDNNSIVNVNSLNSFVEEFSLNKNIHVPFILGQCLFIKHDVINDVGSFDTNCDNIFDAEIDFSIRAKSKGWDNVCNDSIFISNENFSNDIVEHKFNFFSFKIQQDLFDSLDKVISSNFFMDTIHNFKNYEYFQDDFNKKNVLYITSLKNNIPNIKDFENNCIKFNLLILTVEDYQFKFWIINKGKFILINEIMFGDKHSFNLNIYLLSIYRLFYLDFIFVQYDDYDSFIKNQFLSNLFSYASNIGIPILYGFNSLELIQSALNYKKNKDIIKDNIVGKTDKGVVYTTIFDEQSILYDPEIITPELDYICFTNNPNLKSKIWNIKLINNFYIDSKMEKNLFKMFPYKYLKNYDYSIWVDSDFKIIGNMKSFINIYSSGSSMFVTNYLNDNFSYNQLKDYLSFDDELDLKNQINQYNKYKSSTHEKMIASSILYRRHDNPALKKVMEDWYYETKNFCSVDQLTLPYVLYKNKFNVDVINMFSLKNNFFEYRSNKNVDSNKLHVFLINDDDSFVENTVDCVKSFNHDIPITLVNYNSVSINDNVDFQININDFNEYLKRIPENFIIILHSGDLITDDFVNYMFNSNNVTLDVDAIVFDSKNYYSIDGIDNFKPNFSPDFYLEYDYINNSVLFNRNSILAIDGFDFEMGDDFIRDIIFRLKYNNYSILKEDIIGFKLSSIFNNENNIKLVEKYMDYTKSNADILKSPNLKIIYDSCDKKASIIIPFKDQYEVTENCIKSILTKTKYSNYEIILVNNNSYEVDTINFINKYKNHPMITIIDYNNSFNYSKINNYATSYATGDVFVFLNNDTEIIDENWLEFLIGDAIQDGVGAVGGKLYYPDYSIQHIGVVIGLTGLAGHLFSGEIEKNIPEVFVKYRRNVSAVTGACMAIERKIFDEINGFDELFDITGSDVEICLRLMDYGYRNVFNPNVQLIHHERKTRSKIPVRDIDIELSVEYYGPYLKNGDPFFNSHFSLNSDILKLKKPDETPFFEEFLKEYYGQKINKKNKLDDLVKTKKSIKNVRFDGAVLDYDVSPAELVENSILLNNFLKNPHLELNVVMWFVPWFDLIYRGGIYTIFRIANYFSETENTHNIIILDGGNRGNINDVRNSIKNAFPNLNFEVIDLDQVNHVSDLPESDVAFCTYWTTAYSLVKYNNCKAKFYLNQDHEPLFAAAGSVFGLIEETYRFKFIGLANSKGVGDKYKKYGNIVKYFTPAVDKTVYYPHIKNESKKKVVFYGRPTNPRNGFILGIEALKIVKAYFGDSVEIYSAGAEYDLKEYGLEGVINNLGLLDSVDKVADLYRQCDVGLVFMFTPHPSYQPLEYMACGCATVTNINESNLWLLKDKENAILSEPVISCVAENIINLLNDDRTRNNIIHNGIKTVQNFDWDDVLKDIVQFVKNPLD